MSRDPADLAVLVIGGAGGIGRAVARRLIARGARVAVADRDEAALEPVRRGLAVHGDPVPAWPVDVRDPAAVAGLRDDAVRAFGRLDAVINCAAVIRPGPVGHLPPDAFRQEVEVNLLGSMHVAHAFVPYFRSRRAGHLILFASMGGLVPMPGGSGYAATKFGVRGLGLSLALELRGTGVAVSLVCPDSTETPMLRAEALAGGSFMSFASAPLPAEVVARAVERLLRRPRWEALVPAPRGVLARVIACSPLTLGLLAPLVEWLGRGGRRRYLERLRGTPARSSLPAEMV